MQLYLLHGGKTWISTRLLIDLFHVPYKSIMNRLTDSSYCTWNCLKQDEEIFIEYETIPTSTRNKYALPKDSEILEIAKAEEVIQVGIDVNKKRTEYKMYLEHCVRNFAKAVPYFIQLNGGGTYQIHECAKKYSLLKMAISLINRDGYGAKKHIIEIILESELLSDLSIPKNVKDLYKYIKNASSCKNDNELIKYCRHGLLGKKSNNAKLTDDAEKVIIFLARSGNKPKRTTITHQLNVLLTLFPKINGSKLVGAKAVRNFLNRTEVKNLVAYASDQDHLLELEPEVYTHPVSRPLERVYIDGTKLQFIHKDLAGSAPVYRVIIFIIDSFSNKLLGYSLSKTENAMALIKALRMMLQTTNYVFPEEVVTDRGPAMRSKAFKKFIGKINELGIRHSEEDLDKIQLIQSSNAQARASAERFFRSFQDAYLRPHFGFIGEGVTSKNRDAFPNKVIKVALHDLNLLKDENQLDDFIFSQVLQYNKFGFNLGSVDGPNDFYKEYFNNSVGVTLPNHLIPYLCFPSTSIKFANCAIRAINEKQEYIFQKIDSDLALTLTGEPVDCYIDYDDPKEVFLYRASSPKYIASMKRISRINESRRKRGLDAERMFREIMKGKKEVKQQFDERLKNNFNEVMHMFAGMFPHQIVSYSTEEKDSIYLLEFMEELETRQPEIDNILYNSSAIKKAKKNKVKRKSSPYSKPTF